MLPCESTRRKLMPILDTIPATFKYRADLIHLFVGGSELHGAKLHGTDDLDIYGLYIEPPDQIIGLFPDEHFVWSTAGDHVRNTSSDVDVTLYGLRKWASMAAKGNPTALHFLFAPDRLGVSENHEWNVLCEPIKKAAISRMSSKQFKGFVDAQMGRLLGTRGRGKKGQRPELESEFGYDVKAGMHAVRLLNEAIELMNTGKITLPRPERKLLIDIRAGQWTLDKLSNHVNQLFMDLDNASKTSSLPETPDRVKLSRIICEAYQTHWK
jgi:predicted nucleotidyltransferase